MSTRFEELTEVYITSQFDDLLDAGCEAQWEPDGPECGAPASWTVLGHSASKHRYEDCRLCDPCLAKIRELGLTGDKYVCTACKEWPIVKDIRPI